MLKVIPVLALLIVSCSTTSATSTGSRAPDRETDVFLTDARSDIRVGNEDEAILSRFPAASPDDVMKALSAVYDELHLEPDVVDAGSRLIAIERLTRARIAGDNPTALVRCGEAAGPSAASRQRITLSIESRVQAGEEGSVLRTRITGSAERVDGTSVNRMICYTKGALERRIADAVAARLATEPGSQ